MSGISVNRACMICTGVFTALSIVFITLAFLLTGNPAIIWVGFMFVLAVFICNGFLVVFIHRKLVQFSDRLCRTVDDMLDGTDATPKIPEEESLFSKISQRLARLYEVMRESRESVAREREDLQELISDISHQVKTPIASLKVINSTLLEQHISEEKCQEFLRASQSQLEKLEFLMEAMVKTSRLEAGVISLEKKPQSIYDTLASALGGIILKAEKKNIRVSVDCPVNIVASHDRKWTGEALLNILDNAVKYTPSDGVVRVSVEAWDMYVKIDIADSGKGISESRQGMIFKRFYREEEVHDIEGIGLGLYLAREIIAMQGGYIKVTSKPGLGSVFSIFLPYV